MGCVFVHLSEGRFGGCVDRRLGDDWPGIQHVSEWPNSLHSWVHVPVIATSGKGRRSAGQNGEDSLQAE